MKTNDVVITEAKRTAVGSLGKSLKNIQSWQSSDITFLIMGKVQTQGKVGKVGDLFG